MFIPLFIIFISTLVLLFLLHHFSGIRDLYKKTAHIHGPLSVPLLGNICILLGSPEYILNKAMKLANCYTPPFRVSIGSKVWIVTTDPEQIKTILCNNATIGKDNIYSFFRTIAGIGLLTAETKTWRIHRKLLQPAFSQKILQSFMMTFQKNSLLLTQTVEKEIDRPEFDLSLYISRALFSNICETSMTISLDSPKQEVEEYLSKSRRMLELTFQRFTQIWLHRNIIFNLFQVSKDTSACINYVRNFTNRVIQNRRKIMQGDSNGNKENYMRRRPLLDLMLGNNEKQFTDEEICDHMLTIISAGYDTSARTINFILFMLASHPNIQDKVYKEICKIYGEECPESSPARYENLQHLQYLERVIKETMRLFPSAPIIARHVSEDFQLDGQTIPRDCGAAIFILALHRDEKIWPDPLKFDPDRFLPEEVNKRHPCAFIPFSYGSRDCIGYFAGSVLCRVHSGRATLQVLRRLYAMMSMKVFVATFLRKYAVRKDKITPIKDIRLKMDMILQPAEPITFRIERRKK